MIKKTLAIDYGTKRIGLAVSHGTLAEPVAVIANDELVFSALQKIITEEKVEQLLVGISEREMAEKSKAFAQQLAEQFQLPIEFMDETLSSVTIHHKLAHSHMKRSKRQQPIDHYAAAEFLQEWLDGVAAPV
jgi:putative holliday junction resolvase